MGILVLITGKWKQHYDCCCMKPLKAVHLSCSLGLLEDNSPSLMQRALSSWSFNCEVFHCWLQSVLGRNCCYCWMNCYREKLPTINKKIFAFQIMMVLIPMLKEEKDTLVFSFSVPLSISSINDLISVYLGFKQLWLSLADKQHTIIGLSDSKESWEDSDALIQSIKCPFLL